MTHPILKVEGQSFRVPAILGHAPHEWVALVNVKNPKDVRRLSARHPEVVLLLKANSHIATSTIEGIAQ